MTADSVDAYIAAAPEETRPALEEIRSLVHRVVPEAEEKISYRIPTFTIGKKYFAYLAAHESHIGLYPVLEMPDLEAEIAPYRSGKGTLRFPLDEPIPYDLIEAVVAALAERRRP
jgi:uncharacterized protein YdhG (YjbR/CyaY superfamily)